MILTKMIINCETGEIQEIKLTAKEIKEREAAEVVDESPSI